MSAYLLYRGQSAILPVETLLGTIPQLPRSVLSRLVTQMIDRMDEMDGDPDSEPDDEDRCAAGDDGCNVVWLNGRKHWAARLTMLTFERTTGASTMSIKQRQRDRRAARRPARPILKRKQRKMARRA